MKKPCYDHCIYKGSVKELYLQKNNQIFFSFSDKYSVFDWGEMPDLIKNKGRSLAKMANDFFIYLENPNNWKNLNEEGLPYNHQKELKRLNEKGFASHYLGPALDKTGKNIGFYAKKVKVLTPRKVERQYDYSDYNERPTHTLIPLEVIFRFGIPKGSSFTKRMKDRNYLNDMGIFDEISPDSEFDIPIVEFSTKLEPSDRMLSYSEAKKISGLTDLEFQNLVIKTQLLALNLKKLFEKSNIKLWDGKFEFAFGDKKENLRDIYLVDSIGPDELRLTWKDFHLSKEYLRQYYTTTKWYQDLLNLKEKYPMEWKEHLGEILTPSALPVTEKELIDTLYPSLANTISKNINMKPEFEGEYNFENLTQKFENERSL